MKDILAKALPWINARVDGLVSPPDDDTRVAVNSLIVWLMKQVAPPKPQPVIYNSILYNMDDRVLAWMADQSKRPIPNTPMKALGVIDDKGGDLLAGVAFRNERPGVDVIIELWTDETHRAGKPEAISEVFEYAFDQLKVPRISAEIAADHHTMIAVAERLGFVPEGRKPKASNGVVDLLLYGLTREAALAAGSYKPASLTNLLEAKAA